MLALTAGLFCLLLGCENSVGYGNQGIQLPDLPPYVRNQPPPVDIPKGPLLRKDVAPLLLKIRQSEVQKYRAIQYAIRERDYLRWLYSQKAGGKF